jgi:hypothetical protein
VRYVDWVHLIPDSQSPMTKAVAEITSQAKVGIDQIALSVIGAPGCQSPNLRSAVNDTRPHI